MNRADRIAIAAASAPALAEWWTVLNAWHWPHYGLGQPEDTMSCQHSRRKELMQAIEDRIGRAACLAEWNAVRFTLALPDDKGTWELTSRARSEEAAYLDFLRQAAELAAAGVAVRKVERADIRAAEAQQ